MRNVLKHLALALFGVLAAAPAQAYGPSLSTWNTSWYQFGWCNFGPLYAFNGTNGNLTNATVQSASQAIYAYNVTGGSGGTVYNGYYYAGGSRFVTGGVPDTTRPPITADLIAGCIGTSTANIVGLTQNGADGTFETDRYMGFSYTLTQDGTYQTAGTYTYAWTSSVGDSTPPVNTGLTVAEALLASGQTSQVTISFSEAVTGFDAGDLTVQNGSISGLASSDGGITWLATLIPAAGVTDPTNVITLDMTGVTDLVQNAGTGTVDSNNYAVDTVAPGVSIGALTAVGDGTYSATITLSEDSTDFTQADLTLTNASATLSGSGSSYTAILTPAGGGLVELSVGAGTFTDAAGNANTASNSVGVTHDDAAPTVTLSTLATSVGAGESLTVTITFSEAVTGFTSDDVTVGNASLTSLTGSGASYSATLTATGGGDVTVSVAAGVAQDAGGNGNEASNSLSVASRVADETQELITGFMQSRANLVLRHQPGLIGFMTGERQGEFTVSTSGTGTRFNFASGAGGPVWANLTGSWTTDGSASSDYIFGAIGSHRSFGENLMLGAMVEFDHMDETDGAARVRGTGWLVGPYFIARAANQPLFFEGRLLYGESRNKISPIGTYEDRFDTTRLLTQFKVAGEIEQGDTVLMPFLDVSYTSDDMEGYVDSLGNTIPDQKVTLGQIEVGFDFSTLLETSSGKVEFWGGISGIWSETGGDGFARSVTPAYEGGRARVELGMNQSLAGGQRLSISGWYDGIGAKDFESFGVDLGYEMRF
ncbi:MAG: Ig-like domain-containing protein [Paracoccaceae bacterium]